MVICYDIRWYRQTALQAFVESLLCTAIASVTASSSSLPRWPQNTELMKLIRKVIRWATNWKERREGSR